MLKKHNEYRGTDIADLRVRRAPDWLPKQKSCIEMNLSAGGNTYEDLPTPKLRELAKRRGPLGIQAKKTLRFREAAIKAKKEEK